MQSRRAWRIQDSGVGMAGSTRDYFGCKPRRTGRNDRRIGDEAKVGGPVPVIGDRTKSAATSAIVKSKEAKPAASSQQAPQPQGDPHLLVSDACVLRCEPTPSWLLNP